MKIERKITKNGTLSGYNVYKTLEEFVFVEAETASEAVVKSGVENPIKIEKTGIRNKYILSEDDLITETLEFSTKESQFVTIDDLNNLEPAKNAAGPDPSENANNVNISDEYQKNIADGQATDPNKKPDDKLDIEA